VSERRSLSLGLGEWSVHDARLPFAMKDEPYSPRSWGAASPRSSVYSKPRFTNAARTFVATACP
jgi:hypothetical protein